MPAPPWMKKIGGLFSEPQITGGIFGEDDPTPRQDGLLAAASELMAGSAYAPYKRSFGEILGQALAAGQQSRAVGQDRMQQRKLVEAETANRLRKRPIPVATADGGAEYVDENDSIGRSPVLKSREPKLTDDEREYQRAVTQGYKGSFIQYLETVKKAGATNVNIAEKLPPPPQGMAYQKDDDPNNQLGYKLIPVPGARDSRTEAQQKSALLSTRMGELASDIVDEAPGVTDQMAASIAQKGGIVGAMANQALTPDQQKHFNAARGWLAGVLRGDTGATIQPFEIEEYYPTFFPVPGDSKEVVAQKKKLRAVTLNAIKKNSGTTVEEPGGGGLEDPLGIR